MSPVEVLAPEPAPVTRTLLEVKKVYIFPMRGGFDQMLANHLTGSKTFEIVTDSKLADAVLTDNIGEAFQVRMHEIYAPKPKRAEKPAKTASKTDADKTDAKDKDDTAKEEPVKDLYVPPVSTFSRGRGTIFLVDTRSSSVIWAAYVPPKNTSQTEVDRAARRAAEALAQPSKPVKAKKDLVGLFR
jgi:hypothetical protein